MEGYNISRAEFMMVHASIDRLLGLYAEGMVVLTLSQIKILRNIRQKPDYLTISQKKRIESIISAIILRHRDLYSIMTPGQKRKKDKAPGIQEISSQISALNRSMIQALHDSLKQSAS